MAVEPAIMASARFGIADPAKRIAAAEIAASTMVRIESSSLFIFDHSRTRTSQCIPNYCDPKMRTLMHALSGEAGPIAVVL